MNDYKEKILEDIKEIIKKKTKEGKWTGLFDKEMLYHLAVDLEFGIYEPIKEILAALPSEEEIATNYFTGFINSEHGGSEAEMMRAWNNYWLDKEK